MRTTSAPTIYVAISYLLSVKFKISSRAYRINGTERICLFIFVALSEKKVNKKYKYSQSSYCSYSKGCLARNKSAELIYHKGYSIGKTALVSDCSPCPFSIIHLTLDCSDCRKAGCAEKVEYEE